MYGCARSDRVEWSCRLTRWSGSPVAWFTTVPCTAHGAGDCWPARAAANNREIVIRIKNRMGVSRRAEVRAIGGRTRPWHPPAGIYPTVDPGGGGGGVAVITERL